MSAAAPRVLVAGIGNVLRGDDGFGPAVIAALERDGGLPGGVRLVEVGIAGVRLVQELMDGYDVLVMIDAVDRAGSPGSVYVLEPEAPDLTAAPLHEQGLQAADMHQLVPSRILTLSAALGVLPPVVRIVGCQPAEVDDLLLELTTAVHDAVPVAVARVHDLVREFGGRGGAAGADAVRRADELLQLLYWLKGERLADAAGPPEAARFMADGAGDDLAADFRRLASAGLVEDAGDGRYCLTAAGVEEGGRRFAEEFAGMQTPGHGACSDPSCDCHVAGPDACVHAH